MMEREQHTIVLAPALFSHRWRDWIGLVQRAVLCWVLSELRTQ